MTPARPGGFVDGLVTLRYPGSPGGPYDRLPRSVLADLVAICRCLYRARAAAGAEPGELGEIEHVGRELRAALEASRLPPGTLAHLRSWERAELAVARLGELVAEQDARSLVDAAAGAFRRPV